MKNLKVNLVSILLLTIAFTSCGDNEPIAITPPLDAAGNRNTKRNGIDCKNCW